MNKIDWKQKLSSRKFWAAIVAFLTAILTAFNVNQMTIEQVVTVIGAVSSLLIYIFAETAVDVARVKSSASVIVTNAPETDIDKAA